VAVCGFRLARFMAAYDGGFGVLDRRSSVPVCLVVRPSNVEESHEKLVYSRTSKTADIIDMPEATAKQLGPDNNSGCSYIGVHQNDKPSVTSVASRTHENVLGMIDRRIRST